MVYLTLRGVKLSREIDRLKTAHPIMIVEVHPGAVIGSRLSQKDAHYVLRYKQNLFARRFIRKWFRQQYLTDILLEIEKESHSIDACAVALGAWH